MAVGGGELHGADHGVAAAGTPREAEGLGFGGWGGSGEQENAPREETDPFAEEFGGGVAKTEMADGTQSAREDVAQVAGAELRAGDRFEALASAVGAILPAEGDGILAEGDEAPIAEGGLRNIGPEVFDRTGSVAAGLDVHAPVLGPDRGIGLPAEGLESRAEVVAEAPLQRRERGEEVRVPDPDKVPLGVESSAGDEEVDVGMEMEALVPGVEDRGEAVGSGPGSLLRGEGLAQGAGAGGKEEVESLLRLRSEEESSQFLRVGEGDEEVGSVESAVELLGDPGGGGGGSALGTGAVVAAVVGKTARAASAAGMEVPAHGRGAATGDGPDGAPPGFVAGSDPLGKPRQETSQGVDDGPGHGGSRV